MKKVYLRFPYKVQCCTSSDFLSAIELQIQQSVLLNAAACFLKNLYEIITDMGGIIILEDRLQSTSTFINVWKKLITF